MSERRRILIVDDSTVVRRLVTKALTREADQVCETASNGRIALKKLPCVNPDVVILDIEMPVMDGLETLRELRKQYPRLPVIMFSSLTERGAVSTLDALTLGANDYVTKPTSAEDVQQCIREQLLAKIEALCPQPSDNNDLLPRTSALRRYRSEPGRSPPRLSPPPSARRIEILGIGASTGGPNALAEIMPRLPADLPVPVVIVQHMPPVFTRLLAERLDTKCQIRVVEGEHGQKLEAGCAYMAPGGKHMVVVNNPSPGKGGFHLQLNEDPPESSCRPAVDPLFRSLADLYGPSVLAVVLTGMGRDGLRGCEGIKGAGGTIFCQDDASSVVWGMPGFVSKAGLADRVLPLTELGGLIPQKILASRGSTRAARPAVAQGGQP